MTGEEARTVRALAATLRALAEHEPPASGMADLLRAAAERLTAATNLAQVDAALDELDGAVNAHRLRAADSPP
jgi:hypothetical protein